VKRLNLSIRGAKYYTLLKMSPLIAKIGIDKDTLMPKMGENIRLQCEVCAMGILNDPVKIKLFKGPLSMILMRNLDAEYIRRLLTVVLDQMDVTGFIRSIGLTGGLQIQKSQTSLESDTGEMIAPGGQSDKS
jgi:hypothetical protein